MGGFDVVKAAPKTKGKTGKVWATDLRRPALLILLALAVYLASNYDVKVSITPKTQRQQMRMAMELEDDYVERLYQESILGDQRARQADSAAVAERVAVSERISEPVVPKDPWEAAGEGCPIVADILVQHWRDKTRPAVFKAVRGFGSTSVEVLKKLNLHNTTEDYCLLRMRFDPMAFRMQLADLNNFIELCQPISRERLVLRAYALQMVFNQLLQQLALGQRQTGRSLSTFDFWVDVSDGTRNNKELYNRLKLPVLTFARNPEDGNSIPVPDPDMILGLYSDEVDLGSVHWGSREIQDKARALAQVYKDHGWPMEWGQKKPKAVFVGSCVATIASDDVEPGTKQPLRADFCAKHAKDPRVLVRLAADEPPCSLPQRPEEERAWCDRCKECQGAENLPPAEQSLFKYQVLMPGAGGASSRDAAWKLLSKSACIRVRPDTWETPMLEQFFDPLVEQFMLHSTVLGLQRAMRWCDQNGAECEKKAGMAQRAMRCLLRKEVIADYLWGVFTYLHDNID